MLEKKTYSMSKVLIDRPPNPLSIFNVGLDKQLGNQVEIYHGFVPTLWDAAIHGSDNPIMDIFSSIDIIFIFEVVLSLLALIFAYDALAGEYEGGTLRLVLTHPVGRGHILLAKYMSAMLCLLVPLDNELALRCDSANNLLFNFPGYRRFSTDRWDCFCLYYISVCVLSYRTTNFRNNAPDQYRTHAINVRLGVFGIGLSKCDPLLRLVPKKLQKQTGYPFSIKLNSCGTNSTGNEYNTSRTIRSQGKIRGMVWVAVGL